MRFHIGGDTRNDRCAHWSGPLGQWIVCGRDAIVKVKTWRAKRGKFLVTSILVTGGAGYIGSHTCKALRRAGFDPITYDSLTRGNPESVQWGALEIGELADGAHLRQILARYRPAAIVHFAALAYVNESNLNPAAYYRNNV